MSPGLMIDLARYSAACELSCLLSLPYRSFLKVDGYDYWAHQFLRKLVCTAPLLLSPLPPAFDFLISATALK